MSDDLDNAIKRSSREPQWVADELRAAMRDEPVSDHLQVAIGIAIALIEKKICAVTPPSADAEVAALVKRLNEWSLIPPRYNLSVDREMCKEAADALERLARDVVIETAKAKARQEGLALGVEMRETAEASLREAEDKLAKAEATVAGMVKWLEENQVDVFRRGIYEAADAARQAGKGGSE